ncbi:MAG TPA: PLP-dependent aspartate aminotransferase family protein [Pseudomonadota bacterium]|nr:PLP-dependent aspartate aminotransferase family protein [Pseudomonadota bacterium]
MQSRKTTMDSHKRGHLETIAIHAGQPPEPVTGAVTPPIFMTSTYVQDGPGGHKGYEYARTHNPTRQALEANIAALEGGQFGVAFGSACAATTTVLHTLSVGDHVVAADDLYGGTYRIFERVMRQLGVTVTYADPTRSEAFAEAILPNTKLVWIETPTNPLLKLCDIAAVAAVCQRAGLPLFVDNTFMSPVLQRPLELGATAVVHSMTKYLNGHSDVIGGIVVTNDSALHDKLRFLQNAIGAIPSPMDCFLILRGTKTLPLRMERHCQNAQAIAEWLYSLCGQGLVEKVIYPGLPSHPQHALAKQQMYGAGGMISFVLGNRRLSAHERAVRFLKAVKLIVCAESLGGVESLIEHPASMTHASIPAEQRAALGISDGLIRLSVGIEHIDDLRADLEQAMRCAE